jgi:hypothetical protein
VNLVERRDITERSIAAFAGKPLAHGSIDCGKLVIRHLRNMGHRPLIGPGGTWRNKAGLLRFLRRHGGSGAACLDGWGLPRIPPAAAIIGDILELPGEPPFSAFGIATGNGSVAAYHEDSDLLVYQRPSQFIAAWRV